MAPFDWLSAIFSTDPAILAQPTAKVGEFDQGEQQARDPENVHVGEKRDEAQNRDNLELQFMRLVRNALGQRVQPKEKDPEAEHRSQQNARPSRP